MCLIIATTHPHIVVQLRGTTCLILYNLRRNMSDVYLTIFPRQFFASRYLTRSWCPPRTTVVFKAFR